MFSPKIPASHSQESKEELFRFSTKKHYKIWFSMDPDTFMDVENCLRFIRAVKSNPGHRFTLIYSGKCLSESALRNLKKFCDPTKHGIIPLNFDTEIKEHLEHKQDQELFRLAETEIQNTITKQGGSFAAASDIIRLIIPVIAQCGIYGDFEPEFNFKDYSDYIERPVPLIMDVSTLKQGLQFNNDRIAVSLDKEDPAKLSTEAIKRLRVAQQELIANYAKPQNALLAPAVKAECAFSHCIINAYFNKHPQATIFEFRKTIGAANFSTIMALLPEAFCKSYTGANKPEEKIIPAMKAYFGNELLQSEPKYYSEYKAKTHVELADRVIDQLIHGMINISVIYISGPGSVYHSLVNEPPRFHSLRDFTIFLAKAAQHSYQYQLAKVYKEKVYNETDSPELAGLNPNHDQAWTQRGMNRKNERIAKLTETVIKMQTLWKKHAKPKVVSSSQAVSHSSITTDEKEKPNNLKLG